MIIPNIDLMDGKAVQLIQGKEKVLEKENPIKIAKDFRRYGEITVIDLDSALNKGKNTKLIKKLCKTAECRVGGGIRSIGKANEILKAGAKKIIIGTKATPEFLKQLPKDKIIVAIDTKNNEIVDKGWTRNTKIPISQKIKETEKYCSEYLFTNVDIEGTLSGINLDLIIEVKNLTKNKITIAGGIKTIEEVKIIEDLNLNSQIGMAIYTDKTFLQKAFVNLLDFNKNKGLIPTIIQDENNQVLMLAYSNKESLEKTFELNKATYFSRSRKKLWTKGEESGNIQKIIKIRYDCDKDTLLFTVKQINVACHKGSYSCFSEKNFSIKELYDILIDRINNPKEKSYTSKIANSENKIKEKLIEEANEVINYTDRNNLIWEIADLTYFTLMLMAKNKITINEIKNELRGRRK